MFDPTIFDNIKVVCEGAVYDLDLGGTIIVTDRQDSIELSTMSRQYSLSFQLGGGVGATACIRLSAGTDDLAGEILELPRIRPGCRIDLSFRMKITDPERECPAIQTNMENIWGKETKVVQTLSYPYGGLDSVFHNGIQIDFERKFGEEVIEDLPRLLEHMVATLEDLLEPLY
ncbi:hypothetical protein [Gorillibacterium massiliense]|uniref:hypothetical protein n=1 Tax=Gorillibacterium massiliense TaxID=1280390 RepID=UPI0004BC10BB|nr:hypothetical protein [Gorillibacterium massiliense]